MSFFHIVFIYLVIMNVLTFIIYGLDKLKAKRDGWRIPEATLLLLAVVGGSVGAKIAMELFHHKTLHKKFKYGIPIIIIIQMMIASYIIYKFFLCL